MNENKNKKENIRIENKKNDFFLMIIVMIVSFITLSSFMFLLYHVFYQKIQQMAIHLANEEIIIASEKTNNTLEKGIYLLDTTANSIEFLMEQNITQKRLDLFLNKITELSIETIDKNYTGLYGYFRGEYLDGNGWVPPEDYDVTTRPWFIDAKQNQGKTVVVSPYVDAETNTVIISISKLLRDKKSVLALDVTLVDVSQFADTIDKKGSDYVYIVDKSGIIVSSKDKSEIGLNYLQNEHEVFSPMFRQSFASDKPFEYKIDDNNYMVFCNKVSSDWEIIVAVNQNEVLKTPRRAITIGTIIIIALSLVLGYLFIKMFVVQKLQQINERKQLALTQEHAKELENDNVIINSLAGQFEYVGLINIVNHTISNYRVGGIFSNYFEQNMKNLDSAEFDIVIKNLIPTEEFENFSRVADRLFVIRYLQQHTEYSIDVNLSYENRINQYKFIFSVSGQSYTKIILGIKKLEVSA